MSPATQDEKELAEEGHFDQAAVIWKKRTGATLEQARGMRQYFLKHFQKYWGLVLG